MKWYKTLSLFTLTSCQVPPVDEDATSYLVEYGKILEEEYTAILNEYSDNCLTLPYQKYLRRLKSLIPTRLFQYRQKPVIA
jgi:hypothetical protein